MIKDDSAVLENVEKTLPVTEPAVVQRGMARYWSHIA